MNNIHNTNKNNGPRTAILAYSRRGLSTARTVSRCFPGAQRRMYTVKRFADDDFKPLGKVSENFYGELFEWADTLIFVGSCGIAVRCIAPHVKDKKTDPAVICIDELGKSVIPLLSGHIGGANDTARRIAEHIGANAVITTATDINGRFSVDTWATKNGFEIADMQLAKAVSAAVLEKDIPLLCDIPKDLLDTADDAEKYQSTHDGVFFICPECDPDKDDGEISNKIDFSENDTGIFLSWKNKEPFVKTLRIIPKVLHIGIGCRKGTSENAIQSVVNTVLEKNNIDIRAVKSAASIDLKKNEDGLLKFCEKNGWEISFYTADELRSVSGEFTASEFVRGITGVDNVCERAALIGADKLIVKKTAENGVTVAVAAEKTEVRFG